MRSYWVKYLLGLLSFIGLTALFAACSPYMVNSRFGCNVECENCGKQKMECELDRGVKPSQPPVVDTTPVATAVKQAVTNPPPQK